MKPVAGLPDEGVRFPSIAPEIRTSETPTHEQLADIACTLIAGRQNVSPKRLVEPAPSEAQLHRLLSAAAAAPDHGQLQPWRFVIVPHAKRELLAEAFAQALVERSPNAAVEQIEAAREKAYRSPLLMLAVARLTSESEPEIPDVERLVSLGGALQNLQLAAHAMGLGSGLTSGQAMTSVPLRRLFALAPSEQAVCFVSVGAVEKRKPARLRPSAHQVVSSL